MVTEDLARWVLYELEGSGYFADDKGIRGGIKPVNKVAEVRGQNNLIPLLLLSTR